MIVFNRVVASGAAIVVSIIPSVLSYDTQFMMRRQRSQHVNPNSVVLHECARRLGPNMTQDMGEMNNWGSLVRKCRSFGITEDEINAVKQKYQDLTKRRWELERFAEDFLLKLLTKKSLCVISKDFSKEDAIAVIQAAMKGKKEKWDIEEAEKKLQKGFAKMVVTKFLCNQSEDAKLKADIEKVVQEQGWEAAHQYLMVTRYANELDKDSAISREANPLLLRMQLDHGLNPQRMGSCYTIKDAYELMQQSQLTRAQVKQEYAHVTEATGNTFKQMLDLCENNQENAYLKANGFDLEKYRTRQGELMEFFKRLQSKDLRRSIVKLL